MEDTSYRKMYPTGASSPKLYGLPKIHKKNNPLRSIASHIGSVTYGVAKEVVRILKSLTDDTIHHVNNPKEFVDEMKNTSLEEGECITSYDVSALFTLIPVTSAIHIIQNKLEQHTELYKRTTMSANNMIELVEFYLGNTSFLFQGQFFERTKWAAMGSPVSPIVANLYKESFECVTITTAVNPPRLWKRYVDVTFVIQQQSSREESVDPSIIFTAEENKPDGFMPFLDTQITQQRDGNLTTSVYRKPTHTDLYLQWGKPSQSGLQI